MTGRNPENTCWWLLKACLLAVSLFAGLSLLQVLATMALSRLGWIGGYRMDELYADDPRYNPLDLACYTVMPLILALLPRLQRRGA